MLKAQEILEEYAAGLYNARDTVARSIDALVHSDQRDQLWRSLPDWIRQRIDEKLNQFSAGDELVTFSNFDPKVAHDELLELKCWRALCP